MGVSKLALNQSMVASQRIYRDYGLGLAQHPIYYAAGHPKEPFASFCCKLPPNRALSNNDLSNATVCFKLPCSVCEFQVVHNYGPFGHGTVVLKSPVPIPRPRVAGRRPGVSRRPRAHRF